MTMPLEDIPFTEFIQRPTAATGRLATVRALRLRRRDADDLIVMSAVRAEREREVIELTARILSSLVHHTNGHALLQELLPEVLPWARFLPAADRQVLVQEFIEVTEAAASVDNVAPIAQLLVEWRHTAEVHAEPGLHALLSAPRTEDHGPALPPPGWGVSPKRGDQAALPRVGEEYDIRFDNAESTKGWDELARAVPANLPPEPGTRRQPSAEDNGP